VSIATNEEIMRLIDAVLEALPAMTVLSVYEQLVRNHGREVREFSPYLIVEAIRARLAQRETATSR